MGFDPNTGKLDGHAPIGDAKPHVTAEWLRLIRSSRLTPDHIAALVLFFGRATGGRDAGSMTPDEIEHASVSMPTPDDLLRHGVMLAGLDTLQVSALAHAFLKANGADPRRLSPDAIRAMGDHPRMEWRR